MNSSFIDCPDCGEKFHSGYHHHHQDNIDNSTSSTFTSLKIKRACGSCGNDCRSFKNEPANEHHFNAAGFIVYILVSIWKMFTRIILFPFNAYQDLFVIRYGSHYSDYCDGESCHNCRTADRLLQAKCALIENYIEDNLAVCGQLDQVLNLQRVNIRRELKLLKSLNKAGEHLKTALADCLEQQVYCVDQFTSEMNKLEIRQDDEEIVGTERFEENMDELKNMMFGGILKREQSGINKLLDE